MRTADVPCGMVPRFLLPVPLLLVAGCSALVEAHGIDLQCQTIKQPCPSAEIPRAVVETFAEHVPGFDPDAHLVVRWYDSNTAWDFGALTAVGFAEPEREQITVTSDAVMAHELMHVHLYRYRGDPDADHADAGGPWTSAADDVVQAVVDDYRGVIR